MTWMNLKGQHQVLVAGPSENVKIEGKYKAGKLQ